MVSAEKQDDGLAYIASDHDVIRALLKECQAAPPDEIKLQVVDKLVAEVSKHAASEERVLYPLIQSVLKEDPLYYRMATMDDQITKEVLDWLDTHRPAKFSDWKLYNETIDKFSIIVTEHLSHEEEYVLNALRARLSPEENRKLWHDFDNAKKNAPLKPHPWGPTTTTPARMLHPVAGVMDKTMLKVKEGMASASEVLDKTVDAVGVKHLTEHLPGMHVGGTGGGPTTPPK